MDAMLDADVGEGSRQGDGEGAVLLKGGPLQQAIDRMTGLLQPGDLIFIDRRGLLYRQVARATGSWTSQVGLCLRDEDGRWVVYEAGMPLVRRLELERFLRLTRGNRFALRRLRPQPVGDEVQRLTDAAERRVGRFNGMGFDFDSTQLFGPKIVREVFSEALGREPGKVVSLAELRDRLPASSLWFWRLWYLGAIPWERRTITPDSLYTDPGLQTIFESF